MRHTFQYDVRYCLLDLDSPSPPACCHGQLDDRMTAAQARAMAGTAGAVRLLLLPLSAGYEQNPIAVYYCYDGDGQLECCIAEVTNTPWADRVAFAFAPDGDALPKPMHVSPLQDMTSSWRLRASPPGETLHLTVNCAPPGHNCSDTTTTAAAATSTPTGRDFFFAASSLRRVAPPADSQRWAFLMPQRVTVWIYWHAALLLWRGLTFYSHPKNTDPEAYKREAIERASAAGRLCCPTAGALRNRSNAASPYEWRDSTTYPWT